MGAKAFASFVERRLIDLLCLLIQAYRYGISPFIPGRCRFHPTCSTYGYEALRYHGLYKGICLIFKRLFRCHPWGGEGVDPVPGDRKISEGIKLEG